MNHSFTVLDLIRKKRDGNKLSASEIRFLITEYTRGNILDYQMSAFLMSVYFQGMDFDETTYLMQAMRDSGQVLDLSNIQQPIIDKHSTGGVGDKVSLVLAPLVASCGVCVPMISGRGLGHTGGTLDKLESIPGFRTDLSVKQLRRQLKTIGVAMLGQTAEIAPADKGLYALRDVTATVDAIPLISASIMSKKLAEDLDGLVLDVKFGNGAFMHDYKRAKMLAQNMVQIGKRSGVRTMAVLTNMDDPLGVSVGNSLEVIESIEALKGNGPKDLMEVTFALAEAMLRIAKIKGGRKLLVRKITSGAALDKFREVAEHQGGDPRIVEDYSVLPVSKHKIKVLAPKSGYVHAINTFAIGMLLVALGGGRRQKEDKIDSSCGFKIYRKKGDYVNKGEPLVEIFSSHVRGAHTTRAAVQDLYTIKRYKVKRKAIIRETIS
jgi:pyrimidine-nucleoside phosphorylase